jgi:2,3-bisphosphoglycerate-dependent phosphoglycerate mutase
MRTEIILVRHAQSAIPYPGGPDEYHRPLTETGLAQAEHLVTDLADVTPSLIASSPYLRAVQTIEPFSQAMNMAIRSEHELREWDSGLEPTPDYLRHYTESWDNPHLARPGGESLHQFTERVATVLASLARQHPDGTVVIGSHGTFVSRALISFGVTTVDRSFIRSMPMPAIYRLHLTDHGVRATGPLL